MAKDCAECSGTGQIRSSETCPTCKGDGTVVDSNGKVVECSNPRCFWGSVEAKYTCPKCNGTGKA